MSLDQFLPLGGPHPLTLSVKQVVWPNPGKLRGPPTRAVGSGPPCPLKSGKRSQYVDVRDQSQEPKSVAEKEGCHQALSIRICGLTRRKG